MQHGAVRHVLDSEYRVALNDCTPSAGTTSTSYCTFPHFTTTFTMVRVRLPVLGESASVRAATMGGAEAAGGAQRADPVWNSLFVPHARAAAGG
ncbi:hypothetical protein EON67_08630 [archaeon]|nr:MAG: hypothetical protein EON67_08630 [archaeon]